MSDGSLPVRRIGTRAAVRQEASNMVETDTAPSSEPEPSAPPETNTSDSSPKMDAKVEPKQEPMDTSPPVPAEVSTEPLTSTTPTIPIITTLQLKENLILPPLGPSPFTGRKRKANFSNEETETLVRDVVKHFSALYGSEALRTESTRRNQRRSQLWTQIQKHVNDLGYTPRSIDDLKHKWRDLRLEVKRKITHRRTGTKVTPTPGTNPIIDTKLTQLEELVASTIGHHCTLDGEQEGMYMEPGVPRQSIFFSCRGPTGSIGDLGGDRLGNTASPRPEISVVSPLVGAPPTQLSFVHVTEDLENGDHDMEVTPNVQNVQIKAFPENWPAMKEVCTLVTTQNLLPTAQTIVTAPPQILTVKQELVTARPLLVSGRCESQNSVVSSPEGSVGNPAGQTESNAGDNGGGNSSNSSSTSVVKAGVDMVQLKVEHEDGDSQDGEKTSLTQDEDRGNWQENADEWDRQSRSPQGSDNAQEDSLPSTSSQDGDPSSVGELPTNGDCSFDPDDRKAPWRSNMTRLLELEEQWDQLYHRELGIWEEERLQQQQQRNQDRELQQQLLGVLTDIRDELRQLREERAAARQNQAAANGSASTTNTSPTVAITPKASTESPAAAETPAKSSPVAPAKRRGRPRLIRPAPEPVRSIRPAPGSANS
ncbi:uncharacterized protein RB166_006542 [Leptodactylus fuscus]|uniref:uncharacterized protein LOC142201048 n=1 Tax=Leptodactylus fuscus TaxID=238119 RepID=UPI003F4EC060